jgi:hypothetical protein
VADTPDGILPVQRQDSRSAESGQKERDREYYNYAASFTDAERQALVWLHDKGFTWDVLYLFVKTPMAQEPASYLTRLLNFPAYHPTSGAKRKGVQLQRKPRDFREPEGAVLKMYADAAQEWFTDEEMRWMVDVLGSVEKIINLDVVTDEDVATPTPTPTPGAKGTSPTGIRRLAKVFLQLQRQKDDENSKKSAEIPYGLLPLWTHYVEARCRGLAWVGEPYAWNPALLPSGKHEQLCDAIGVGLVSRKRTRSEALEES